MGTSAVSNHGDGRGSLLLARHRIAVTLADPCLHKNQAASFIRERDSQAGEYAAEERGLCELATCPNHGLEGVAITTAFASPSRRVADSADVPIKCSQAGEYAVEAGECIFA